MPRPLTTYADLARDMMSVARTRRIKVGFLTAALGIRPAALFRVAAHPAIYGGTETHLAEWTARWEAYKALMPVIKNGRPTGRTRVCGMKEKEWGRLVEGWRGELIATCRTEPINLEAVEFAAYDYVNGLEVWRICGGEA